LRPILEISKQPDYLIAPAVNRRQKIFAAAIAVGLHIATDVISYDLARVEHFGSDKAIRAIFAGAEMSESKLIMREAAYALSHFLRFSPSASQIPRLVPFVYQNLAEFELFETWAASMKAAVKADPKAWLLALKAHCGQIGLKTLFPE
jgi:hypothetical protein